MSAKALLSASVSAPPAAYVEDVFSTYLYTGTGSTKTITNGIDLAGEGGLVWIRNRGPNAANHALYDTERGVRNYLSSNLSSAQDTASSGSGLTSFNSTGFSLGGSWLDENNSGQDAASWTFRKAPRFFDVVTYTGNGDGNRAIPHGLGVAPGFIAVKRTDGDADWATFHRSVPSEGNSTAFQYVMQLNADNAQLHAPGICWGDQNPDDANFYVDDLGTRLNASGATYVAYLFAHDPLGPSGDGSDGLIACGSYTGNGSTDGPEIDLGWEPQWLMIKRTTSTENWAMYDSMRGIAAGVQDTILIANGDNGESSYAGQDDFDPTATGFKIKNNSGRVNESGNTYIYIAIRRGPMRAPTSGTEVFDLTLTENASEPFVSSAFPVDTGLVGYRSGGGFYWGDRIRGNKELVPSSTADEATGSIWQWDYQDGWLASSAGANLFYSFKRAPGFFDVVAYTGNSTSGRIVNHNLKVAPELIITKTRSGSFVRGWAVYHKDVYSDGDKSLFLDTSAAAIYDGVYYPSTPNSTSYTLGVDAHVNNSSNIYIAYLFATLAGVSKVGSYTGNSTGSTTQTIDCGFTSGARFVLIKKTNGTGPWAVFDVARGIAVGNDPYLNLDETTSENNTKDRINPNSSGFTLSSNGLFNGLGDDFIFLAIA